MLVDNVIAFCLLSLFIIVIIIILKITLDSFCPVVILQRQQQSADVRHGNVFLIRLINNFENQ